MKATDHNDNQQVLDDIAKWVDSYKRINEDYLMATHRCYAKIRVHPWSSLSMTGEVTPEPTGIIKEQMMKGLIEIYDAWKTELDEAELDYYLKIWLYEPRFSQSQVVCAVGSCLNFYENTFFIPDTSESTTFPTELNDELTSEIDSFNWEYRWDEEHFDDSQPGHRDEFASQEDYEDAKRWFESMLKKPHRTTTFKEPIGDATKSYSVRMGDVWLGERS